MSALSRWPSAGSSRAVGQRPVDADAAVRVRGLERRRPVVRHARVGPALEAGFTCPSCSSTHVSTRVRRPRRPQVTRRHELANGVDRVLLQNLGPREIRRTVGNNAASRSRPELKPGPAEIVTTNGWQPAPRRSRLHQNLGPGQVTGSDGNRPRRHIAVGAGEVLRHPMTTVAATAARPAGMTHRCIPRARSAGVLNGHCALLVRCRTDWAAESTIRKHGCGPVPDRQRSVNPPASDRLRSTGHFDDELLALGGGHLRVALARARLTSASGSSGIPTIPPLRSRIHQCADPHRRRAPPARRHSRRHRTTTIA